MNANTSGSRLADVPHHHRRDVVRAVPVQVELEGHDLVVVSLKLTLDDAVRQVGYLGDAESSAVCGVAAVLKVVSPP